MKKTLIAFALLALLGMSGWGVVAMVPGSAEAPPVRPPASTPAMSQVEEMRLERAEYRARTLERWHDQRRARIAAEAEARRVAAKAERAAQEQLQQEEAAPETEGQNESGYCYPAGCVPPVDPDLPDAPDNAGEFDGGLPARAELH